MANTRIIPRDYQGESTVTPIFLVTVDQDGNALNPALIQAVEAQHRALCGLAKRFLGDASRVSDLAQAALRRVETRQRNGKDQDEDAKFLIYGAARAIARDWRYEETRRAAMTVSLDSNPSIAYSVSQIPDPTAYDSAQIERIDSDAIIRMLVEGLSALDRRIVDLWLRGMNCPEIAETLRSAHGILRHRATVHAVIRGIQRRAEALSAGGSQQQPSQ